ncbi:MAG: sugar phosphate isomerase/epimerase, partial [Pirellulaceae bacterium]
MTLSRRSMLRAAAFSTALGTLLRPERASALFPLAQQASPLKLGIQLYSLRGFPLDVALQHAKDLGFQQVELYSGMLPLDASDEQIA